MIAGGERKAGRGVSLSCGQIFARCLAATQPGTGPKPRLAACGRPGCRRGGILPFFRDRRDGCPATGTGGTPVRRPVPAVPPGTAAGWIYRPIQSLSGDAHAFHLEIFSLAAGRLYSGSGGEGTWEPEGGEGEIARAVSLSVFLALPPTDTPSPLSLSRT